MCVYSNILSNLGTLEGHSFPVLNKGIPIQRLVNLDLSIQNSELTVILEMEYSDLRSYSSAIQQYINTSLSSTDIQGIGGYLEVRHLYQKSPHFLPDQEEERNIHLGIDIWDQANTPVHSILQGSIHSLNYNNRILDYGGTIITKHHWNGFTFHCLYGHLSKSSLLHKEKGMPIECGTLLGHLGAYEENGGWPPHLHFQLILDMEGWEGDYPGVAANAKLDYYKNNCPDPSVLLQSV